MQVLFEFFGNLTTVMTPVITFILLLGIGLGDKHFQTTKTTAWIALIALLVSFWHSAAPSSLWPVSVEFYLFMTCVVSNVLFITVWFYRHDTAVVPRTQPFVVTRTIVVSETPIKKQPPLSDYKPFKTVRTTTSSPRETVGRRLQEV